MHILEENKIGFEICNSPPWASSIICWISNLSPFWWIKLSELLDCAQTSKEMVNSVDFYDLFEWKSTLNYKDFCWKLFELVRKKQREKDYWLEEMKTTVKDQACDKYIEEINICDVVNNIKTFRPGC